MNHYFLRDFNPAYAEITPIEDKGLLFGYCDPELVKQAEDFHDGNGPEDIIITITDKSFMACVVYARSEEGPEDVDILELSALAGLRLLLWAADQQALTGEEVLDYVQRQFLKLAYEPNNNVSVSLGWLGDTQRKVIDKAYRDMQSTSHNE